MNQGHFCYICVDLPEVAQQEAAFLGIFFCVEEATAATIPFFTAQKPVCTEKCQISSLNSANIKTTKALE